MLIARVTGGLGEFSVSKWASTLLLNNLSMENSIWTWLRFRRDHVSAGMQVKDCDASSILSPEKESGPSEHSDRSCALLPPECSPSTDLIGSRTLSTTVA